MINFFEIVKNTSAYKSIKSEKLCGKLSHAYLLLIEDKLYIKDYLKVFAKMILGVEHNVRESALIENGTHPDVMVFPKDKEVVLVEDVNTLIEESYYKPEGEIKLFIIENAQTMNTASQNKLLKTLEEPPKNVVILLGATSEFSLLQTVKSRVKKFEFPPLSINQLINALNEDFDEKDINVAISLSDKTLGKTVEILKNEKIFSALSLANDLIENMSSSGSVLDYSYKTFKLGLSTGEFLEVLSYAFLDLLKRTEKAGVTVNAYKSGAIINALDKITEAQKRLSFNGNEQMILEWLYLQILEGRYKWQKL